MQAPSPIVLVHCIGTMHLGGAEKQLAELICRLPRERFEQSLVLVQGGGPLIERVERAGCRVIELGYRTKFRPLDPRCYWWLARAEARFVRRLRSLRPQILHAQLYWANILGALAARLAGVPAIITSRRQLSRFKEGRPWLQWIEDATNPWSTRILANSEAVRRDVLAHERIDPGKIRVIRNGVVLEDFGRSDPEPPRREFGIRPDDRVLLVVGNLHPYKGHEDLLRAAACLVEKHPNLRILMPGRDDGMGARLERLVADLGLEGVAHLAGERADIPALLALADIVVHPSHEEGFSNAILEAMAAGKPLVVTNVGGNPEAVRDGENGIVVPVASPEAMATAIEELLSFPALRIRMGEESRRRVEKEFSMGRVVEQMETLYEELAGRRR